MIYSTNGRSTKDLMISYLQCLSDKCHKAPICLIWDQFKAHLTQDNYTNQYKLIIIRF